MKLDCEQRLLCFVEALVRSIVASQDAPDLPEEEDLQVSRGLFVTLRVAGELRGCIGSIAPRGPLPELAMSMAKAALADDRFPDRRIQVEELEALEVEVTILDVPREIAGIEEFEVGRDGIIIEVGDRRGVFLPQVALEQGWDATETFEACCRHKLGLPPGSWQLPEARLLVFEGRKIARRDNDAGILPE